MRRWRRPYALDAATGFAVLGLVGVVGFATLFVITPMHEQMPTPLAILFGMWLAVVAAVAARQAMLGVYVSDAGVRSRSLLRTTTLPWASVADIHSGVATFAGLDMGRAAIVIERTDGVSIQTPLQRGDFFRPFTFRPELGRLATWPEHYDEILATLRTHLREAKRQGQAPVTDRPAQPPAAPGARPTIPTAGVPRTRTAPDGASGDKRRDIHALTRQHQRGALSDAEFAAELAKIQERD